MTLFRGSESHEAGVSDSEMHKADEVNEVSEVRLGGEIDNELDEDCEVYQSGE